MDGYYTHIKKGGIYRMINYHVDDKTNDTICVLYQTIGSDSRLYVRSIDDFNSKMVPLKNFK